MISLFNTKEQSNKKKYKDFNNILIYVTEPKEKRQKKRLNFILN